MAPQNLPIYEFGPFGLDAAECVLFNDGRPIPLSPKVFATLLILVEEAGRTVPYDEFITRVWPDTAAGRNNLDQNIFVLRKALDDTPASPRYIETVRGRG